jgi:membrane protein required for colicin V production
MPLTLFDMGVGAVLIISAVIGWIRGATREVLNVGALVVAAIVSILALRYSGPIARHAIHTAWIANIVAILIVFVAAFAILRIAAAVVSSGLRKTSGFGAVDRAVGAGFGVARALVVLGVFNLTLSAVMPPGRMPGWISGSYLYPMTQLSAAALKAFAPEGAALARQVGPSVSREISDSDSDGASPDTDDGNRAYNGAHRKALAAQREQPR